MKVFEDFILNLERYFYQKLIFIDNEYKIIITRNNFEITKNNINIHNIMDKDDNNKKLQHYLIFYYEQSKNINVVNDLWIYNLLNDNKDFFIKFGGVYISSVPQRDSPVRFVKDESTGVPNDEYYYDFSFPYI